MPDYSKGKIYTIRCRTDDSLIYVGSTIQPLAVRWGGHKVDSKREQCKNRVIYITINNDWDNWYIELYELYPCNTREELERKEGEIIRQIGTLNCKIAGRTDKEYYIDNKEDIQKRNKEYSENNKNKILEYHKEYHENNKEKLIKIAKEYYENNKDKINEKITCECGCVISKQVLKRHLKTQKHLLKTGELKYEFVEDID
jgi:hypothetical protein